MLEFTLFSSIYQFKDAKFTKPKKSNKTVESIVGCFSPFWTEDEKYCINFRYYKEEKKSVKQSRRFELPCINF